MKKVVGILIRSRESKAVLMDEEANILAKAREEGANYHINGVEKILNIAKDLIGKFNLDKIDCACFGVSGCDRASNIRDLEISLKEVESIGDAICYNVGPIIIVGASGNALGKENLLSIEADTGVVGFGVNKSGEMVRTGGWGYIIDDEGGAFDIGKKGLMYAARSYDRIEKTDLEKEILNFYNLHEFGEIIDLFYEKKFNVKSITELFPLVCKCAESGDKISLRILNNAASTLSFLILGLVNRLDIIEDQKVIYTSGRIFENSIIRKDFEGKIKEIIKNAVVKNPMHSPEVGAAILALEKVCGELKVPRVKNER